MGKEFKTLQGNQYATIFVVNHTRVACVFLHDCKSGPVVASLIRKARAKLGSWPARVSSDGVSEYDSPEVLAVLLENNIEHEWSNTGEQFQDGTSEALINTFGHGVLVLLLFSGLAPEFWGMALLYYVVDVYNCLPHSSLKW
eukprot:3754016-Rhodomonas_salina.1